MSTISASTTSTTAYKVTADTTGTLVLQTGSTPTTAVTIGTDQSVTFAGAQTYSGGTANGVAYLNGSKVLTTGTALVFDGSNLGIRTASPQAPLDIVVAQDSTTTLRVQNSSSGTSAQTRLLLISDGGNMQVKAVSTTNTTYGVADVGVINCDNMSGGLKFSHDDSVKMTLASSGSLLVGTTTDYATLSSRRTSGGAALYAGQIQATNDYTALIEQTVSGGNGSQNIGLIVRIQAQNTADRILACQFNNANSPIDKMYVQRDGSSYNATGTWGTISDARIKQDIIDASSQWEDFKKIKFRKYRLIDDVEAMADAAPYLMGPVAQELEEAGMNGLVETPTQVDGTELNKQVKLSIMYMKGMKALQEAMLKIEEQQAIIETLTNRISALENK